MSVNLARRNRLLLVAYLVVTVACLLPALGLAFNSSTPVLGIPLSVLWLAACFIALAALTVVGYKMVFIPWSQAIDSQGRDLINSEGIER